MMVQPRPLDLLYYLKHSLPLQPQTFCILKHIFINKLGSKFVNNIHCKSLCQMSDYNFVPNYFDCFWQLQPWGE